MSDQKKRSSEEGTEEKRARIKTVDVAEADDGVDKAILGDNAWKLGSKNQRFVSVSEFKGMQLINIREYYVKDNKLLPGKKGISLTKDQFEALKDAIPEIEALLR